MVRSVLRVLVGLVAFVVVVAKGVTRAFLAELAHAVAQGRWAEKAPVVLGVATERMANWANQVQKALADCQDQQAAPAAPGPKDHVAHKVRKIVRLV
jgi:hypothetical protein